jgi:tRNA threonylcarbamoyladenosine biosynthesis protein TsaB
MPGDVVATAFNARRNEVYLGVFAVHSETGMIPLDDVRALQSEEIATYISAWPAPRWLLAGEGAVQVASALNQACLETFERLPDAVVFPGAGAVARLGAEAFAAGRFEDLAAFEPFYLKEFVPRKQERTVFDRLPF